MSLVFERDSGIGIGGQAGCLGSLSKRRGVDARLVDKSAYLYFVINKQFRHEFSIVVGLIRFLLNQKSVADY